MTTSDGANRLTKLKKESQLTDSEIGRLVGVSGVTFLKWRTGAACPEHVYRVALAILTTEIDRWGGAVAGSGIPTDAWDASGAEAEILSRVKPLGLMLAECG